MELTFAMGWLGLALLVVGALIIGVTLQFVGNGASTYEWIGTSIAAFIGGFAASELFLSLRDWQPVMDGIALIPAIVGGLAVGGLTAFTLRVLFGRQLGAEAH